MDKIIIKDLEVFYRVGVPDEERAQPQRLLLTVEMEHHFSRAAASDDLNETIDYFAVSERLRTFGEGRNWKLIETLAVEIADFVL
jgi:7,8-dihydroneopterin aldolase/epimerase/oxygenase